jgi:hypothetical protein
MSNPDWAEAPEGATHWDNRGDCFCNKQGWYLDEKFIAERQLDWGEIHYEARPQSQPDWTEAHDDATHYDAKADVFCKFDGYWCGDEFVLEMQKRWGVEGYIARPVDPPASDWVDGWPPVGWHGELQWGVGGDWFECVVIPGDLVVVQGSAGNWNIVDDMKSYNFSFQELQAAESERDIVVRAAIEACPYPGSSTTHIDVEALYDAGMLSMPED